MQNAFENVLFIEHNDFVSCISQQKVRGEGEGTISALHLET